MTVETAELKFSSTEGIYSVEALRFMPVNMPTRKRRNHDLDQRESGPKQGEAPAPHPPRDVSKGREIAWPETSHVCGIRSRRARRAVHAGLGVDAEGLPATVGRHVVQSVCDGLVVRIGE
jgi:hypothetical protein